jgi:hypothetical protein
LLGANSIKNGASVLHVRLKRRSRPRAIGRPEASPVEENQPREGSETITEAAEDRQQFPREDGADHERREEQVAWAIPYDEVRYGGIAALGVANVGLLHLVSLSLGG